MYGISLIILSVTVTVCANSVNSSFQNSNVSQFNLLNFSMEFSLYLTDVQGLWIEIEDVVGRKLSLEVLGDNKNVIFDRQRESIAEMCNCDKCKNELFRVGLFLKKTTWTFVCNGKENSYTYNAVNVSNSGAPNSSIRLGPKKIKGCVERVKVNGINLPETTIRDFLLKSSKLKSNCAYICSCNEGQCTLRYNKSPMCNCSSTSTICETSPWNGSINKIQFLLKSRFVKISFKLNQTSSVCVMEIGEGTLCIDKSLYFQFNNKRQTFSAPIVFSNEMNIELERTSQNLHIQFLNESLSIMNSSKTVELLFYSKTNFTGDVTLTFFNKDPRKSKSFPIDKKRENNYENMTVIIKVFGGILIVFVFVIILALYWSMKRIIVSKITKLQNITIPHIDGPLVEKQDEIETENPYTKVCETGIYVVVKEGGLYESIEQISEYTVIKDH